MATAYLLIYSGAEGPSVPLQPTDALGVLDMASRLSRTAPAPVAVPLGIGGVMVEFSDDASAAIGGIIAHDGRVAIYGRADGDPTYMIDDVGLEAAIRRLLTPAIAQQAALTP